jgi:porin
MHRWVILLSCLLLAPAYAQQDKKTDDLKPSDPDTGESTVEEKTLGLLPNPFEKNGVKFAATYIGEVLGNPTGGAKRGSVYEDRINLAVDADLQKLFGLNGLAFHANLFRIDGGGLSRGSLLNLLDVSGIEALPTTRLYEIWFEKKWNDDKIALRAGQLAADSEFATSKYTDVFTNASLGWPGIFALNMPSGGPSPPLATMGTRFRTDATDNLTLVAAVFDGNAAGPGPEDPQLRNRYGVNFRVNDPPLFLSEPSSSGIRRRAIRDWMASSSSADGATSHTSTTSVLTQAASRLRAPQPRTFRQALQETTACMPSLSRSCFASMAKTTVE